MASCSWKPKVQNQKGELVESRLFNDLLSYTQNRQQSKEYYVLGKNQEFLNEVSEDAKFDENGEITFNSLRKEANLDIEEEKIIAKLNKDLGSGEYPFDQAITKMQYFNTSNPMRDDFMATISIGKGDKVKLEVVKNTPKNQDKLIDTIKNRILQDRLKYYLTKHGVNVSFLDSNTDSNINGRYSTENIEKTSDGLYNLIQIAHGKKGEEALAEETGHFIIGALSENPLVDRLISLLTDENMQKLLGDTKYNETMNSLNPKREAAGYLIGESLKQNLDNTSIVGRLTHRIVSIAKRIFYKIKGDDVAYLKSQVEDLAYRIASGAINDKFEVTVDNALKTKETLYSAPDSKKVEKFKEIVKKLQTQVLQVKVFDKKASRRYQELHDYVATGKIITGSPAGILGDMLAYDGIVKLLEALPNELLDITDKVANIDINYSGINSETASTLRQARILLDNTYEIRNIIMEMLTPGYNIFAQGSVEYNTLYRLVSSLNQILGNTENRVIGLNDILKAKELDFYTKFLEMSLGAKYITRAKRVVFKMKGKIIPTITTKDESQESIEQALRQQKDEGWLSSILTSMSNSSSLTNKIVDKMFRTQKKMVNDRVLSIKNELTVLEKELKEIGGTSEEMFERVDEYGEGSINGKLTGNLIDEYLYGVIEKEYDDLVKTKKEEFYNNLDKTGKTREQITVLWMSYFNPINKQFINTHFVPSTDGKSLIPNDKYKNQHYIKHIKGTEKEKWLNKYKALKRRIDLECLDIRENDEALLRRAPQFKGWTIQRVKNRSHNMNSIAAWKTSIWEAVSESFIEDSEDRDYGSQYTYNPDEEAYTDKDLYEEDKINRVPLFGINKLKNMETLSTDLFQSTVAYASMAYRYNVLKQVANTLEVGREVLKRTNYERKINKSGKVPELRTFSKFQKFVDKELYGFRTYKISLGKLVFNKVASFCTQISSYMFLGGNVTGGAVNVMTGGIEVFKEAFSGEHFDVKSWRRANSEYFKYIIPNILNAGALRKYDKISLFIEHFDTLNRAEEQAFNFRTRESRLWRLNPFGQNVWLPYKSGEHYMQTMTFLSAAMSTKLYDKDGKETTLYDAFEEVEIKDNKGKVVAKELQLKKDYVFKKEDIDVLNMISAISTELNNSTIPSYTQEQLDFLNKYDIDPNRPKKDILNKLQEIRGKTFYSPFKESEFINKCREINNRLHGIYNNQDKASIQQHFIMNALFSMRNYAFGMISRRFGGSHYNLALGHDVEGTLITTAKVLTGLFDPKTIWQTFRFLLLPFTNKSKSMMLSLGFNANQIANMRRNFADMSMIAALFILKLMTAKSEGDDDDEDDITAGICYYFASRLLREQAAFNTPMGLYAELPVITNIEPAGVSAIADLLGIAELLGMQTIGMEDAYYKKSGANYKEGESKAEHKIERLIPFWRSYLLLQNPYKAAESYEFGRANKSR